VTRESENRSGQARTGSAEDVETELRDLQARLSSLEQSRSILDDQRARIRLVVETQEIRRRRDGIFGRDLFGDPAWDILLELYLAELEDRQVLLSHVDESEVAPSTVLRWLNKFEREGWTRREPDPTRGRRIYAMLTPKASKPMRSYVDDLLIRRMFKHLLA
jgi:hypothetical protein